LGSSLGEDFVLKTTDRATGVPALLKKFDLTDYSGKQVTLKANFKARLFASAHRYPANIVVSLKGRGSGLRWGNAAAWETPHGSWANGCIRVVKELGFNAVVLTS
jgi:hypothetical protein